MLSDITDDYKNVKIWCGDAFFQETGLAKAVDEYFAFIENEFDFLDKRNARIKQYCETYLE